MKSWQQKLKDDAKYWRDKYYNLQSEVESQKKIIAAIEGSNKHTSSLIESAGRIATAAGESVHAMSNFIDKASRIMDR